MVALIYLIKVIRDNEMGASSTMFQGGITCIVKPKIVARASDTGNAPTREGCPSFWKV